MFIQLFNFIEVLLMICPLVQTGLRLTNALPKSLTVLVINQYLQPAPPPLTYVVTTTTRTLSILSPVAPGDTNCRVWEGCGSSEFQKDHNHAGERCLGTPSDEQGFSYSHRTPPPPPFLNFFFF